MIKSELIKYFLTFLVTLDLLRKSVFGSLTLKGGCTCPGYPLVYECTVFGKAGGTTVWTGSAFNCTNREISLFHGDYESAEGAYGECGDISGQSIAVTNDSFPINGYISQLIVIIRSIMNGMSIECLYDDGTRSTTVGQLIVTATTAPFPPPNRIYLSNADLNTNKLTFSWSPVAPDCPAIHYNIMTSNCGSCPTTTNHTTVTCTDVPINGNSCMFALQTVVCGYITGKKSETIQGILKGCLGCTGAIVSASLLAIALSICIAAFTTLIIYLVKDKIDIKGKITIKNWRGHTGTTSVPPDYEDVRRDNTGQSKSTIDTRKNIAYSQGLTVLTTTSE